MKNSTGAAVAALTLSSAAFGGQSVEGWREALSLSLLTAPQLQSSAEYERFPTSPLSAEDGFLVAKYYAELASGFPDTAYGELRKVHLIAEMKTLPIEKQLSQDRAALAAEWRANTAEELKVMINEAIDSGDMKTIQEAVKALLKTTKEELQMRIKESEKEAKTALAQIEKEFVKPAEAEIAENYEKPEVKAARAELKKTEKDFEQASGVLHRSGMFSLNRPAFAEDAPAVVRFLEMKRELAIP